MDDLHKHSISILDPKSTSARDKAGMTQQPGSAVQGNFEISVSTGLVKSGILDSVQITGNSFTIRGTEDTQTGPVCTFSQLPSSATITGQCGTGVTIQFATADGETATFTNANVQCTTTF